MKNRTTAGLLALFLGGIGVHRFYLGKTITGFLYLIFCFTFVPALIAFFEALGLFFMSDEKFNQLYNGGEVIRDIQTGTRVSPATHVKCPDCREFVMRDARVCKHCGCRLVPQ